MQIRNTICAIFIFSLTSSALLEKLGAMDMPHIHAEIVNPEVVPSVSSGFAASGGIQPLVVNVSDLMPSMGDSVCIRLA